MKSTMLGLFAIGTALISTSVVAQESYDLGTIVLSPSLSPVELGRTGTTVEVLEGEEVGEEDSRVLDRLVRLPGVNSTSNGPLGSTANIQVRGLPGKYVGVRIDGIEVTDPASTQKQFGFGGLTSSGIQRIELLKGSQSALYGSEAIAGVINITTFSPEKLGFSGMASVEGGSYNTYSGTLSTGYRSDRGFIALSYGRTETDGFSARSYNTEKDGFEQTTVNLTGEYRVTESLSIGGALLYRDGEVDIDRGSYDYPDAGGVNLSEERGARVFATLETGVVTHTLSYNYFDIRREDPDGFTRRFTGERHKLSYLGSAELSTSTVLNFGVDHVEEKFTNDTLRGSEDSNAIKTELLFSPTGQIDVSAALRYDYNSDFGGKMTGRLAAAWRPADDVIFRAVIGTGYRAPSPYERFSDYGVRDLEPEESRSYEVGVEKTFSDLGFVKATVFYTDINDLIGFDGDSMACGNVFPGCYNQVPGTTNAKGIELSAEYVLLDGLKVFGAYTYTDSTTAHERTPLTPKHDFVLSLNNAFTDRLAGYVDIRHVADVLPTAYAPPNHKVGDYTLVGAGISYDVTENAQLYLRIENLFDEAYETAGGFNQPGRSAYVGLRASF